MWKIHVYWLALIRLGGTIHVSKEEQDSPILPEGAKNSGVLPGYQP